MDLFTIGNITFGMGLISWVIFGKVKHIWNNVQLYKKYGDLDKKDVEKHFPQEDGENKISDEIMYG